MGESWMYAGVYLSIIHCIYRSNRGPQKLFSTKELITDAWYVAPVAPLERKTFQDGLFRIG